MAHLTASALITDPDVSWVCLVLHGKLGWWLQTGGHLEPADVDLASAAGREAREESGLDVLVESEPLLLSAHPAPCRPDCLHLDVQFRAVSDPTHLPQVSAESRDVRWFPVDALPETDDTVRALVSAARRRAAGS